MKKVPLRRRHPGGHGDPRASGKTAPRASQERRAQLRFVLTFLTVAVLLFSLYSFPYDARGEVARSFERYLAAYARLAGWCLSNFDPVVRVHGALISGRFSLEIVKSCDAMEANLLFVSAIAAWPARWYLKLMAGGIGLALLVLLNIIRICTLYAIGIHFPSAFQFFHIDLWPMVLVLAAGGAFVTSASWMQTFSSRSPFSPAGSGVAPR